MERNIARHQTAIYALAPQIQKASAEVQLIKTAPTNSRITQRVNGFWRF
jgi:hypothetical protein